MKENKIPEIRQSNTRPAYTARVRIRAEVTQREQGMVDIGIDVATLSREDEKVFHRLFPHTSEEATRLLIKEAFLVTLNEGEVL